MSRDFIETLPEKLARLIRENPGMPVTPAVDYDVCCDDSFAWWIGKINTVDIKTRVKYSKSSEYDHIYFDESDKEEILEMIIDDIEGTDDERTAKADKIYAEFERERVIVITIGTP